MMSDWDVAFNNALETHYSDAGIEVKFVQWEWIIELDEKISTLRTEVDKSAEYHNAAQANFASDYKAFWLKWKQWVRTHTWSWERVTGKAYLEFLSFERDFNAFRDTWLELGKETKTKPSKVDRKVKGPEGPDLTTVAALAALAVIAAKLRG